MPVLNNAGACTCPPDNTEIKFRGEVNLPVGNSFVGVIAIHNDYDVIFNPGGFNVFACDVVLIRQTGLDIVIWPVATHHVVLGECHFSAGWEDKTLGNLRPDSVVLVRGNRDGSQNTNNGDDDNDVRSTSGQVKRC